MSLIIVISGLAAFIALGALWMSSVAIRRGDTDLTDFTTVVRKDLGNLKTEVAAKLTSMENRLVQIEKRVDQTKDVEASTRQMITDVNRDMAVLRDALADIETSIPPQFRRRKPGAGEDRVRN